MTALVQPPAVAHHGDRVVTDVQRSARAIADAVNRVGERLDALEARFALQDTASYTAFTLGAFSTASATLVDITGIAAAFFAEPEDVVRARCTLAAFSMNGGTGASALVLVEPDGVVVDGALRGVPNTGGATIYCYPHAEAWAARKSGRHEVRMRALGGGSTFAVPLNTMFNLNVDVFGAR